MTRPSDAELLRSWRTGDAGAFAALVDAHQGPLLRHARALLGPGSAYEDVVQEVFLKLAQSPPDAPHERAPDGSGGETAATDGDARERAGLSAWLHKVTRNACMDVMRSETRRRHREEAVASGEAADGGIAAVEGRDTRAAVERELAKLPVDQREVLVLRLLGERSYREIAEITGKKVGTVGWLISVGLQSLGAGLAPLLHGDGSVDIARGEVTS